MPGKRGCRLEEKKAAVPHTVEIKKRQTGRVTGVKEVDSFSEEEILLQTEEGRLRVKGSGLHIQSLNLKEGILTMEGRTDSLTYLSKGEKVQAESFMKRLFR